MNDFEPILIIDSREQTPLFFPKLKTIRVGLTTGDYSIQGLENYFAVERKSIADLVGCCVGENRERFERELMRLKGIDFRRLIIVGSREDVWQQRYHSNVNPRAVMGSISTWEIRYSLPVCWFANPAEASAQIESWAMYFVREFQKISEAFSKGIGSASVVNNEQKGITC